MWSTRPSVAAAVRESHVRAFHARASCLACANDAVESTVRCRSGSRAARSRVPCARQFSGARVEWRECVFELLRRQTVVRPH
eukprot:11178420-Lingulodinium_polyedra.AAC.1